MPVRSIISIATAIWPFLGRRLKLAFGAWLIVPAILVIGLLGIVFIAAFFLSRAPSSPEPNGHDEDADLEDFDGEPAPAS